MQQSKYQPHLPILPLTPRLIQVHNQTPLPTLITHSDAPDLSVKPFLQALRVQSSNPAHVSPPMVKHATSSTIDPSTKL